MRQSPRWRIALWFAAIFATVFVVYQPALDGTLLWDDAGHVTRADLRSMAGLGRIWFEIGATQQYYPVLHSAFWIEHRLWGDAVVGYHVMNVALHASAACLFALVLRRLLDKRKCGALVPWFAALLFALHPVCVESVAWISEQKNTLSAVFYLAAALAYLRFDATRMEVGADLRATLSPSRNSKPLRDVTDEPRAAQRSAPASRPARDWRPYVLATFLFVTALLTKTVTATLPATLLVVFWWQRGRVTRRDVIPLLPWFAVGAFGGLFTAHFERQLIGAQGADFSLSLLDRALLAGRVVCFYLGKLVWPAHLTFIYPRWTVNATDAAQWLFGLAAIGAIATLVLLYLRAGDRGRAQARATLAAVLIFGGTLFPVLGFFNVFPFRYSYVADHFQYLAALPIFALSASALCLLGRAGAALPVYIERTVAMMVLVALGALTWRQAATYRDARTLYETTLARNPACWMAHNNLAIVLADAGRLADAVPHLETALSLHADFPEAENNLGDDLVRLGRVAEAIPHFERALRLQPNYAVAHRNLGVALAMTDRTADAVAHFARAVEIEPAYADAELDWAMALAQTVGFDAAVSHFERALALAPRSVDAQLAYADALAARRDFERAAAHYRAALESRADSADAHRGLATALHRLGRDDEAAIHERAAQQLSAAARP